VLSGSRGAAARLGINRSTLQFRMKKLGIMRPPVPGCPTSSSTA
jgi:formate hydrogenlyase transcriptional activator